MQAPQLVVWIQGGSYSSCICYTQKCDNEINLRGHIRSAIQRFCTLAALNHCNVAASVNAMSCFVEAQGLSSTGSSKTQIPLTVFAFAILTVSPGLMPLLRSKLAVYLIRVSS